MPQISELSDFQMGVVVENQRDDQSLRGISSELSIPKSIVAFVIERGKSGMFLVVWTCTIYPNSWKAQLRLLLYYFRKQCASYAVEILRLDPSYFQDDNANCHAGRSTMDWYEDNGMNRLDWPAQISDLNPIENLRDELDCRIKVCSNSVKSMKELSCFLQAEWRKIPLSIIQTFVEIMPW
ncbi:transposable element tcb1 transposase [Trichonephila clavipes]|nr:transposable element tcb1 transposase [Trichonephila clavipes]